MKHLEKHQDRASAKVLVTPNPSVWAMLSLHSTWWLTHPCHVYICAPYCRYDSKEDTTLPSQTPNTRTQSFLFLWATGQQEGQYCFRAGDKASFSEAGRSWCHGAAGEKSVIIVTKHRHCYPPSLRSFSGDDHNWFKGVQLSMIKFKELC